VATATLKARYVTAAGKGERTLELPPALFDGVVHEPVLYAAVKAQLANRRQGTAAAKTRSEVSGGGRKPWRQKGTGRARQGSIRAAQWRGGGVVHPPLPREWRENLPKGVRALARRSALNARARAEEVVVVDALTLEAPRTRHVVAWLRKLGIADRSVLLLTAGLRPDVVRAARNLPNVLVRPFGEESAYDCLWAQAVVIEEAALGAVAAPAGRARDA
jgi:large subunit ribosomal protein L4